jgi:hypothetical protein
MTREGDAVSEVLAVGLVVGLIIGAIVGVALGFVLRARADRWCTRCGGGLECVECLAKRT